MSIRRWSILLLIVLLFGGTSALQAQTQPPTLFFSNLDSGPNTGGETVNGTSGAYVTIYGNFLGSSQGTSTVTWNGLNCLRVVPSTGAYTGWGTAHLWYQEIVVQLGSSCTPGSGNFVVTTSSGSSNGLPFTVKALGSNHVYFVATSGNDSNAGTFASPFQTATQCAKVEVAGDVCYVENGVNNSNNDWGFGALTLGVNAGVAGNRIAIGTYPGATSTMGSNNVQRGIILCNGVAPQCPSGAGAYWTVFGFTAIGYNMGINVDYGGSDHNKIVALNIQCPAEPPGTFFGCFMNSGPAYTLAFGNEVWNVGNGGKETHGLYFGADGHDYEVGWNSVHDVLGCRGMQFYNGSTSTYNLSVHDNLVYNVPCDGIDMVVDTSLGYANIYNNVFYHVGAGPDQGSQNAACIYTLTNHAGPTPIQVYDNTFYDCGALGSSISGMLTVKVSTNFVNNIFYSTGSEQYITANTSTSNITGSNNIWFGQGNGPSQTTGNINLNPQFVTTTGCSTSPFKNCNLQLQATSPAIGGGILSWLSGSSPSYDIQGQIRPTPRSIGAYEFSAGTAVTKPNPPTNLTVIVK